MTSGLDSAAADDPTDLIAEDVAPVIADDPKKVEANANRPNGGLELVLGVLRDSGGGDDRDRSFRVAPRFAPTRRPVEPQRENRCGGSGLLQDPSYGPYTGARINACSSLPGSCIVATNWRLI
jgi:hypothetical protein